MNNESVSNYNQAVGEISQLVLKGIECWCLAGEKLCGLIDKEPNVIERICEEVPFLSANVLRQLERIGRKQLLPELLFRDAPGFRRLQAMPFSIQKLYSKEPVELLVITDNGPDTLKVAVGDLTAAQAKQVFGETGEVRTIPSQRAWLASQSRVSIDITDEKPYAVSGRNLVIRKPCKLSLQEIGVVLAEMKS